MAFTFSYQNPDGLHTVTSDINEGKFYRDEQRIGAPREAQTVITLRNGTLYIIRVPEYEKKYGSASNLPIINSGEEALYAGFTKGAIKHNEVSSANEIPESFTARNEKILQTVNPKNPNASIVTSNVQGVLKPPRLPSSAGGFSGEGPIEGGQGGTGSTSGGGGGITKPVSGSVAFKNTDSYKALPKDMQDFVDIAYNLIEVGGEEEARQFSNAISQAKAVADPYFKTQLSLALAEVQGTIAERNNDFQTKSEIIKRTRDELLEDVKNNKDFLTLEQQSEVAREAKQYDSDLLTIADQAAEKGLTFATGARSRALAEERRGEEYKNVIESRQRKYNFQVKDLGLRSSRGDTEAQKQLDALTREKEFGLQKIGRSAEQILGSANLPAVEGFTPTGGAIGDIEEKKRKTILSDVGGFMQLQRGFI